MSAHLRDVHGSQFADQLERLEELELRAGVEGVR
jgi:hypothetical protein